MRLALAVGLLAVRAALAEEPPADPREESAAPVSDEDPAASRYRSTVRTGSPVVGPLRTGLPIAEATLVPGTGGDGAKAIEAFAGVARPAPSASQLVVWGAAPADTRAIVDSIEIPSLYHAGGVRAAVPGALLDRIDLMPGAYDAGHGRALGGLLLADTRALPDKGIHGYVGADLLDASAMLSAAIGSRFRVAVAGRYGYLDRLAGALHVASGLYQIPGYDDYQAKITVALRSGEELGLLLLGADDRVAMSPIAGASRTIDTSFQRIALRYGRVLSDEEWTIEPWAGRDERHHHERFGLVPAALDVASLTYGLRADWRRRLGSRVKLSVGIDWQGTMSSLARSGSLTIPAREGDLALFGQPPGAEVNTDDWRTHIADVAPHATLDVRAGPVTIRPGLRVDAFLIEGSRLTPRAGATPAIGFTRVEWAIDPRLLVIWRAGSRVTLSAAGGVYHQPPAAEELGAVFGNPSLGPSRAVHATLGAIVRAHAALTVDAVGFYKHIDGLAARSAAPTPIRAQALVPDGTGQVYGAQLTVRLETIKSPAGDFFGWIAYTLSRSERLDVPGAAPRLFDFDQTHVLSAVASWTWRGWSIGLRLRYATGMPRTPVVSSIYDASGDRYDPVFGAHNGERLPAFVQLDARVAKRIQIGLTSIDLYVDAQNVTNQRNAEEVVYSFDLRRRDYIGGLPFLAVAGARLGF